MKYALIIPILLTFIIIISCRNKTQSVAIPSNAYLVDVRTVDEFKKGSVPNAINIPLSDVENSIDKFTDKENIVVFCRSGNRSKKAKKILEANGIKNVTNGGSWKNVLSVTESK